MKHKKRNKLMIGKRRWITTTRGRGQSEMFVIQLANLNVLPILLMRVVTRDFDGSEAADSLQIGRSTSSSVVFFRSASSSSSGRSSSWSCVLNVYPLVWLVLITFCPFIRALV